MSLRFTLLARSAGADALTPDDLKCIADPWHPDKATERDNTDDQTNARLFWFGVRLAADADRIDRL